MRTIPPFLTLDTGGARARTNGPNYDQQYVVKRVGFKNGTSRDLQISIDACISSMQLHSYLGISRHGIASVLCSAGNADCRVILCGGSNGPSYDQQYVADATAKMVKEAMLPPCLVIDCSHRNSVKMLERQPEVAKDIGKQIFSGGGSAIKGVMIESNLVEGAHKIANGYGQSVADACIGWESTESKSGTGSSIKQVN